MWHRLEWGRQTGKITTNQLKNDSLKSLHRCVFAFKPTPARGPVNVTRNVVFQEVLEGVRQAVPASDPPPAPTTTEVDDITDWTDYEAIEVEMEHALDEDAVAEEGPTSAEETRRRVEARKWTPPIRQKQPRRDVEEVSLPTMTRGEPCCEYERIKYDNEDEINAMFYETFGYHISEARSSVRGVLGHQEADSENDDEEEQV